MSALVLGWDGGSQNGVPGREGGKQGASAGRDKDCLWQLSRCVASHTDTSAPPARPWLLLA